MLAVGSKIIGFFPGYLHQEGYSTGGGFSVIGLFVHGKAATVVAVVILAAIAVAIYRFCDPDQPWRGGVLMTSAALAVCTPDFQWYAILLVMLVALDGRPEWLAIAAGGYFTNNTNLYLAGVAIHHTRLWGYGGGAAVACACALVRYVLERRAAGRVPAVLAGAPQMPEAARAEMADGETTSVRAAADRVIEPTAVYVKPPSRCPSAPTACPRSRQRTRARQSPPRTWRAHSRCHARFLPRAYRKRDLRTRRRPSTVNRGMSYQDPPRHRHSSRYPTLAQYEDSHPPYQDSQRYQSYRIRLPGHVLPGHAGRLPARERLRRRIPWLRGPDNGRPRAASALG